MSVISVMRMPCPLELAEDTVTLEPADVARCACPFSLKPQHHQAVEEGTLAQFLLNTVLVRPIAVGIEQPLRRYTLVLGGLAFRFNELRHLIRLQAPAFAGLFATGGHGEVLESHRFRIRFQAKPEDAAQLAEQLVLQLRVAVAKLRLELVVELHHQGATKQGVGKVAGMRHMVGAEPASRERAHNERVFELVFYRCRLAGYDALQAGVVDHLALLDLRYDVGQLAVKVGTLKRAVEL